MNYYLGIDNGLTSIKSVLFNENGERVGICEAKTPLKGDVIDADLLWSLTAECIRKSVSGIDKNKIRCVANSGHGNGLYAVKGEKCIGAFSSMTDITGGILKNIPSGEISDITLQGVWLGQPAPIMRCLKDNCKDVYFGADYFMFCKDYIKYKLTANATTDYSDASAGGLLDGKTKAYSQRIFEIYDIKEACAKMPPIVKSYETAGSITAEAAALTGLLEGTPVAGGLFDVNACMIGSGAFNDYCVICGTWGINSALSDLPVKSDEIRQCCVFSDNAKYICIDSAPSSAVNLEWFANNIIKEKNYQKIDSAAAASVDNDIIYTPFIYDKTIGGNFFGLSYKHTDGDMIKAILDGVCFEHRRQLENLKKAGIVHSGAVISGGAANSKLWTQLFADILEIPVSTVKEKQAGALGAAVCAAVCSGEYKNIYAAAPQMVKRDKTYVSHKSYGQKYERYKKIIKLFGEM